MIIQQERNLAATAPDNQLMAAVVKRQGVLVNPLTFETSTIWKQLEVQEWSGLLKRVLQELPQGQKEAISLASKGMSRREIAAESQISGGKAEMCGAWA